ncbi:uncharacterized protein BJ171DRAFT_419574 [Polychytrium aggregatum]|uniref:uncharacterized protein n=1 Tax=Polychytrium aggregatum TaxID=110093 RepID=UPI0022FF0B28|nr:uncharacterized protein BJ171DRAFT_419574 [Polychytrium aggregatum]KAI9208535.1 hypothetical protein BJ171DRAFT_419574 [Polychytrium aggregatum]
MHIRSFCAPPPPLNQVLGDYVDNLETKQLNIGIWSGNVILNNLKLRREALDKFNLPIDITEGYLGRLTLSIPWSDLTNKPVHISIDQVYLIAKPKADTAYDEVLEDERAQKLKQDRLATAEMVVDASSGPGEHLMQEDQSFLTQLTQKIVDNIQVQIKNIHVRFEDSVSSKVRTPFAVGITLSELSITSTNTEWVPAFIQSENGLVHKLMKLEQLAVYWNTKLESLEGYDQKTAMLYFLSQISHKDDLTQHQYILKPVSGVGKLKMHKKYVPGKPLYDADIEFDKLAFNLDDDQYHCLLALLASFSLYIKSQKYRSLRPPPGVRPKDNPRAWLEYAGQSVLREVHEKHRKMTWAYFEERRDDRKEYIEHYKKMRIGSITADERIRLSDLERKLDYTDIKFYRTIARSQLKKEQSLVKPVVVDQESAPTPAAASQTWVGWLFGASATEAKAEEAPQLTEIDMEQIKETIEFDPEMTLPSDLPNDAVYCKIKWQLESGSFTLLRNDEKIRQELISVAFQKLAASLVAYPKSYLGEMKVQDMTSTDNTTPDNLYSSIIKRSPRAYTLLELGFWSSRSFAVQLMWQRHQIDTEQPFFNMKFELNPLDERADKAIEIRMLPLEVVYNPVAISALVSFFTPPEEDIDTANTLLAVAQDTLQGMASQTRAGLEYLLETRQTLELKVDLEAPYLFVPENCTDKNGYVLLVNMGHLYVESDLVSKEKKKQLQAKQGTKLSPKDLETLRSLLYDRFKCQLNDVQFLVGVSAEDCRAHAQNSLCSDVHFVERVDMEFCFESCIIPGQNDLPQTKISGKLPRLHLNFSDRKYKVVMRLLDTIFGAKPQSKTSSRSVSLLNIKPMSIDWRALSSDNMVEEEFFDAEEMPSEATGANQPDRKLIDFQFEITHASASVKKSNVNRNLEDQPLADLVIKGLSLKFVSRPFDMNLDVNIKELLIEDKLQPQSSPFPNLLSTSKREQDGFIEHFVAVSYASVNPSSPYYKGESQIVRIDFASADFVLTRSSVLSLYDYILTTFAGNNRSPSSESLGPSKSEVVPDLSAITSGLEEVARRTTSQTGALIVKIRVKGFNVIMNQDERRLASIYFGSGLLAVTLKDNELAVKGQLGKMSVFDDLEHPDPHYPYRQLLSIEGDQVADFAYQTYSPSSPTYPGHDQYLRLRTGSLKLTFVEASLNGILAYLQEFQRMHVYETARKAAIETAVKQMETVGRFCYDVQIQTPIVILPDVTFKTRDTVTMYLGAISAKNSYTEALPGTIANQLVASVSSMRLESSFIYAEHAPQVLPIIDNVTISINLDSLTSTNKRVPDNSICVDVSEVKLRLTTQQYEFLLDLSTSVMRFLGSVSGSAPDQQLSANDRSVPAADGSETNRNASAKASLEAVVKMPSLFLEIFHDTDYSRPAAVSQTTLARFSVDQLSLQYATKADSSMAVELRVKSISLEDTRPDSQSLFRNVIPVSAADKDVLLVSYEVSSAGQKNVLVTVDSPKFILALDHLFAMRSFAVAPKSLSASSAVEKAEAEAETEAAAIAEVPDQGQSLTYRIALVDMEMTLVQDPTVAHSEAILLCGKHLVLSYDTVLVLSVKELGMFFCAMDKRAETTLRFIQNFDLALNMDERITSPGHKMTNLMINVTPLILRVSYKDMALITDISNTFTKLSTQSTGAKALDAPVVRPTTPTTPHYIMCRERLQLITQGFHLVLIDDLTDLHLPMFDASFDDVYVELFDWSSMPRLDAGLLLKVNYFNLKNSHWEPLVEPWQCSLHVMHPESKHLSVEFVSRKKLDVNISHVFCETVMSTMALLKKNQDRNLATRRDIHAPYLLRNRTGYSIFIWSEAQADTSGTQIHTLGNNDDMPWRFEEWRATRESTMPVPNKLSVQINGPSWESLKNITVDTEGVVTYLLRPMINQITHRFVCDVRLKDNIKIVTFRSVTVVQNETNLPLELMVVNSKKQMTSGIYNMEPGQECFIPIEASYCDSIMIRPHEGFGYKWSTERLYWRDLQRDRFFPLVECPSYDVSTPVFRFQVNTIFHSRSSGYPMMTIKLLPPFLLENLLPYNFKYVIVDKHGQQEHRDQLTRGEAAYIHTVNPTHVLVLAIEIPGTPYGRSEVAVICHSDTSFRDETLQLSDADGRQLRLRIKYSDKPERGGRKVTIYSPYVLINQTGLDLIFSSRSLMSSSGNVTSTTGTLGQDGEGGGTRQDRTGQNRAVLGYSSGRVSSGSTYVYSR